MNKDDQQTFSPDDIKLFSDDVTRKLGPTARLENIKECLSVCETMKTLLGPKSYQKLLVQFDGMYLMVEYSNKFAGDVAVTNDGATVLSLMDVNHPAAKLLVQLSRAMDEQAGDGTTSVVVLAGSLLYQTEQLLLEKIHPMAIIRGFTTALDYIHTPLENISFKFDVEKDLNILMNIAKTTLNSKLVSHTIPELPKMAVSSIIASKGSERRIEVLCESGGSFAESYVMEGNVNVVKSNIISTAKQDYDLKKPIIAVLSFPLTRPRTRGGDFQIDITSSEQIDRLIKEEEKYIKKIVIALKKLKVNVICLQENISPSETISDNAKQFLGKAKILSLQPLKKEYIKQICESSDAIPIVSSSELVEKTLECRAKVVEIERFYTKQIGDNLYSIFQNDSNKPNPRSCIVLKGPSLIAAEEAKRALHDALRALETVYKSPIAVPGGGACEMAIHTFIQKRLKDETSINGTTAKVIKAFSNALEEIPRILANNAGMDSIKVLNTLRQCHFESDKCDVGIDMTSTNSVTSMKEKGILELKENKMAQIIMAVQVAIQIIKIDSLYIQK